MDSSQPTAADRAKQGAEVSAQSSKLGTMLLLAAVAHALVIFGVGFSPFDKQQHAPQLKVTLAAHAQKFRMEDATRIAPVNQKGSGNQAELDKITSTSSSVVNSAAARTLQGVSAPVSSSPAQPVSKQSISSRNSKVTIDNANNDPRPKLSQNDSEVPQPQSESDNEMASLQARLDNQTDNYSKLPKIRRLTSLSAKSAVEADYLRQWRERVESVGNRYYPEASLRYGLFGSVRLLVRILSDGSIDSIEILQTSSYTVLDQAAIKTVRLAAPFAPFPPELLATTSQLEIIRSWQFQENHVNSN